MKSPTEDIVSRGSIALFPTLLRPGRFCSVEVALVEVSKNPISAPKRPAFPVHPGEQNKTASLSALPPAGSAFAISEAKAAQPPIAAVTDGKYAAFVGSYDGGNLGLLTIRQEGAKLFAVPPSGERVELVPEPTGDKFSAQPVGGSVAFERNEGGKVTGIVVTFPDGRVLKARKI